MPPRNPIKPMNPCSKEADISEIRTEVHDLKKIVKGNGQKGLQQNVTELNINVPLLTTSVDTLSKQVKILLDRKVESDTEKSLKMSAGQRLTAIISGIIGASTVIVMIADMIMKHQ